MSSLTGTGALVRLAARRDRLWLLPWLLGIVILGAVTASSFAELYPTAASRAPLAATAETNPALLSLVGRGYDLLTVGGLTAWRLAVFGSVIAALMNIFLVVRHTRADEENGRTEILGSAVVGRRAGLSAALIVSGLADLALVVLLTAALSGSAGLPLRGSFALAAGIGLAGAVFAGIAAITAQCAATARGATGAAGALLGLAFLVRAAGDLANSGLGWLSPLGWVSRIRAFAGERWEILALLVALVVLAMGASVALAQRREYGAGLLPTRPGRSSAAPSLSGPMGLAWRLQRGAILGWCLGFGVAGVAVGSVARDVGDLLRDSPAVIEIVQQLGGADSLVDAYLTTTYGLMALLASGFAISCVLRLRHDETSGYAEALLAAPLARLRWAGRHGLVAAAGATAMMLTIGVSSGLIYGLRIQDVGGQFGRQGLAALAQTPAVWVVAGVTMLLIGWSPRAAAAAWGVLLVCVVIGQFGAVLQLPAWVIDASPFGHVPVVGDLRFTPIAALSAIALLLAGAGLIGLRRRDIG